MGAGDGCGGRRVDAVEVEPKQAMAGRTPASTTILQVRERANTNGAPEQLKPEEAERQGRLVQWCAASLQAAKGSSGRSTREQRERNGGAAEEKGIGLGFTEG
jgi:hypothetical protein